MTHARAQQVSLDDTPYYHLISRCVRRAFLCGEDALTGRDFSHRREWIETRLLELTRIFAIDVCAYAVMSNHYHVVIRVDRDVALEWSAQDVLKRWLKLYNGPDLIQRFVDGDPLGQTELRVVDELIETYRARLHDLSWYMRCINEPLARMANQEDGCTGRFWEGRFKSQALLDERALVSCMTYVDLNPIRAGIADTPEHSEYTSIHRRIREATGRKSKSSQGLLNFGTSCNDPLPYEYDDYLDLVDWAGRAVREDKKGAIPADLPSIIERLNLEPIALARYLRRSESPFNRVIGPLDQVRRMALRLGKGFYKGSLESAGIVLPAV